MVGRSAIAPATSVAPVADTSAGTYTWKHGMSGIHVNSKFVANIVKLCFNGEVASSTQYDRYIAAGEDLHITAKELGLRAIYSVSVWVHTGGVTAFGIRAV